MTALYVQYVVLSIFLQALLANFINEENSQASLVQVYIILYIDI